MAAAGCRKDRSVLLSFYEILASKMTTSQYKSWVGFLETWVLSSWTINAVVGRMKKRENYLLGKFFAGSLIDEEIPRFLRVYFDNSNDLWMSSHLFFLFCFAALMLCFIELLSLANLLTRDAACVFSIWFRMNAISCWIRCDWIDNIGPTLGLSYSNICGK